MAEIMSSRVKRFQRTNLYRVQRFVARFKEYDMKKLQNIYVYNASSFKQHDSLWASVSYISDPDTYYTIGAANYESSTNRIVFDGS
jgi:hypothetical protein